MTPVDSFSYSMTPFKHEKDAVKLTLILLLFFFTLLACLVPFSLKRAALHSEPLSRRRRFVFIFSMLSCFGGGVLLATCLLDLLPDALESMARTHQSRSLLKLFPMVELLTGIGFMLVLSMEQMTMIAREKGWLNVPGWMGLHGHENGEELPSSLLDSNSHEQENSESSMEVPAEDDDHFNPQTHSTIRAVLLVLALSLHAVFEGVALGMQADVDAMIQIFLALLLHKCLIAFSLGLRLVQSLLRPLIICICCFIFASMTLFGGFFGLLIMDLVHFHASTFLLAACLQAVACGTFLYITCFEILPHELNRRGFRLAKLTALFLGFLVITVFIGVCPH